MSLRAPVAHTGASCAQGLNCSGETHRCICARVLPGVGGGASASSERRISAIRAVRGRASCDRQLQRLVRAAGERPAACGGSGRPCRLGAGRRGTGHHRDSACFFPDARSLSFCKFPSPTRSAHGTLGHVSVLPRTLGRLGLSSARQVDCCKPASAPPATSTARPCL